MHLKIFWTRLDKKSIHFIGKTQITQKFLIISSDQYKNEYNKAKA